MELLPTILFGWMLPLGAGIYGGAMLLFRLGLGRVLRGDASRTPGTAYEDAPRQPGAPGSPAGPERVTVVIAARNEELAIGPCLDSILACDWPRHLLEIVVVDDASEDGTAQVVARYAATHPPVRLIALEADPGADRARKKAAVARGVEAGSGAVIMQTDADCRVPAGWIAEMMARMDAGTGFVAGPVAFEESRWWFSPMVQLEYAGFMGIAAGAIGLGRPILCSAANIAWRRSVYDEVGGHADLARFSSGDDDLLMQRIARKTSWAIRFCASRGAIVRTCAPASMAQFLAQRRRWASKGAHYESIWIVTLNVCFWLFFLMLPMGMVASVWIPALRMPVLLATGFKIGSEGLLLWRSLRHFAHPRLMRRFLPAQPFQVLYILWAGLAGLKGDLTWKSRRVAR